MTSFRWAFVTLAELIDGDLEKRFRTRKNSFVLTFCHCTC